MLQLYNISKIHTSRFVRESIIRCNNQLTCLHKIHKHNTPQTIYTNIYLSHYTPHTTLTIRRTGIGKISLYYYNCLTYASENYSPTDLLFHLLFHVEKYNHYSAASLRIGIPNNLLNQADPKPQKKDYIIIYRI